MIKFILGLMAGIILSGSAFGASGFSLASALKARVPGMLAVGARQFVLDRASVKVRPLGGDRYMASIVAREVITSASGVPHRP